MMPSVVGISRVARILLQDDYDFTRQRMEGETVFLRVNFNVPRSGHGEVLDWSRVDSVLPTIRVLQQNGARIVVGSHLGGSHIQFGDDEALKANYSLNIVQDRLAKAFGESFRGVTESAVGPDTSARITALRPGEVLINFCSDERLFWFHWRHASDIDACILSLCSLWLTLVWETVDKPSFDLDLTRPSGMRSSHTVSTFARYVS